MPNRQGVATRIADTGDDQASVETPRGWRSLLRPGRPHAGSGFGLLFLDLDAFKAVNDARGHEAGDALLRAVGETLRGALRGGDVAGRWGGDEFVAVLPSVTRAALTAAADRCRALVAAAHPDGPGPGTRVTISVGAALARPGEDPDVLIARADDAMYASKLAGRDRVTLAPDAAPAP